MNARAHNMWDVRIPMRDGIHLSADVWLPSGDSGTAATPAVIERTPYHKQNPRTTAAARYLSDHGYAVVTVDVRGRHDSDGEWLPFRQEGPDGYDTVEWVARQDWCDGRVGTLGASYGGWTQWALAREQSPHLKTMVSTAAFGRWMEEVPSDRGMTLLVMFAWLNLVGGRVMQQPDLTRNWAEVLGHLPVRDMDAILGRSTPFWREWLDHPQLDDYWQQLRFDDFFALTDIPVLHITGWYDGDQAGALFYHQGMTSKSPATAEQSIIIGPWDHSATRTPRQTVGGLDFGSSAVVDLLEVHRRWFDRHLREIPDTTSSTGNASWPRSQIFLTGHNRWHRPSAWPFQERRVQSLYLDSPGDANTMWGRGLLIPALPCLDGEDSYRYDPADPVRSMLDENFYSSNPVEWQLDTKTQQRRDDVLCYTSESLGEELLVAGYPRLIFHAASDGPDTDWVLALHDVRPNGSCHQLATGRLRARFRESLQHEVLMEADHVYEFIIELSAVCHAFRPGHAIRITVTSSDFPLYDRNLNTGESLGRGISMRIATNRLLHGPQHPSRLVLPIVDAGQLGPISSFGTT